MQAQNIEDIYTLSPTQQGMLFHILSAPDSRMYVEQTVCTLHATLNISASEQVWQQVIDRHPSLRTAFVWQGLNQPVQIVHQQVRLAIAVVFEGQQLTYRELNAKANQLARYLHSLGVRPEVLVGICVERSLLMVIGLLGILKAGGAYVPLDPAYPQERLTWMLSDSQVSVLLTQKHLLVKQKFDGLHVISLDTDWEVISQESEENLVSGATPENLAYIIYTSIAIAFGYLYQPLRRLDEQLPDAIADEALP